MASAGSLIVEIGANVASLRTGLEEASSRLNRMERQVQTSSRAMQSSFEGSLAGIRTSYLKAAGVIYGAINVISKAWDLASVSAEYEEQAGYLDNLSKKYKTTSNDIIQAMASASGNMVAKADLMATALSGVSKGLNPEQLINMARAAKTLGDVTGTNTVTAMQNLTEAIETGRSRGLVKMVGTALDLKTVFGELEGKLTDTEKAHALYAMTMLHVIGIEKEQTSAVESVDDKMQKLQARYKDITLEVGNFAKELVVATADLITWAQTSDTAAKSAEWLVKAIPKPGWLRAALGIKDLMQEEIDLLMGTPFTAKKPAVAVPSAAKPVTPGETEAEKRLKAELASMKKQMQARSDAEKANKDAARDAQKLLAEQQKEAKRLYEEDYRAYAECETNKRQTLKAENDERIKVLEYGYKYSEKTYADEAAYIMARRDSVIKMHEDEKASLQSVIDYYGDAADKQAEIEALRAQQAVIDQEQLAITAQATRDLMDAEMERYANLQASMAQMAAQIEDMQSSMAIGTVESAAGPMAADLMRTMEGKDPYQKQIDDINNMYDEMLGAKEDYMSACMEGDKELAQWDAINQRRQTAVSKAQYAQRLNIASNAFGMMANLAMQYYEASGRQSEEAFRTYKALMYAQTVISTAAGIMQIWSDTTAGAWYTKAALSAMVAATGAMQLANIAAAQPGGASSSAPVAAVGAPSAPVPVHETPATTQQAIQQETRVESVPTIQIYVQGNIVDHDKFARELIPALTKAMGDRVR